MTVKSISLRAAKTFLQAALAVLTAAGTGLIDVAVWKAAAVAGIAAVLSYAQNAIAASE